METRYQSFYTPTSYDLNSVLVANANGHGNCILHIYLDLHYYTQ